MLAAAGNVEARLKYYRYNDNIPMVEMSLNMMVAMGVLEPIPSRLVHDGNPYNRLVTARTSRYSRYPYARPASSRYSSRYRSYDDYWDRPMSPYSRYSRSRYYDDGPDRWYRSRYDLLDSPWSDLWGDPRYTNLDDPWYGRLGGPRYSGLTSPWASTLYGSPWNNPWNSAWTYPLLNPWPASTGYLGWPYTQSYSTYPYSIGILPDDSWGGSLPPGTNAAPDPAPAANGFDKVKSAWSASSSRPGRYRSDHRREARTANRQLDGLWVGDTGEMLGIRGDRFLWYDDSNKYARGQLIKSPTTMQARIPATRTVVRFHYKIQGDEMLIMSRDGKMRTFNRMPLMQARGDRNQRQAVSPKYQPTAAELHLLNSSYRTDTVKPRDHSRKPAAWSRDRRLHTGSLKPSLSRSQQGPAARVVRVTYNPAVQPASLPADSITTDSREKRVLNTARNRDASSPAAASAKTEIDDRVAQPARSQSEDAGNNDAYSYLFSYFRDAKPDDFLDDQNGARQPASTESGDGSGVDTLQSAATDVNIWRPNAQYPQRRRQATEQEARSSAGSGADFSWPENGVWE